MKWDFWRSARERHRRTVATYQILQRAWLDGGMPASLIIHAPHTIEWPRPEFRRAWFAYAVGKRPFDDD